jgi:hypothetical protein
MRVSQFVIRSFSEDEDWRNDNGHRNGLLKPGTFQGEASAKQYAKDVPNPYFIAVQLLCAGRPRAGNVSFSG